MKQVFVALVLAVLVSGFGLSSAMAHSHPGSYYEATGGGGVWDDFGELTLTGSLRALGNFSARLAQTKGDVYAGPFKVYQRGVETGYQATVIKLGKSSAGSLFEVKLVGDLAGTASKRFFLEVQDDHGH